MKYQGKGGNDIVMTPPDMAEKIVSTFQPSGSILEPCKGNGAFLEYLPNAYWCEIKEGRDFFSWHKEVDWIVTNPPWSLFRDFLNHSMRVSNNIVFLVTVNHLWTRARRRDITSASFGIKTILELEQPDKSYGWPHSGFQLGAIHLRRNYIGPINITS